MELSCFVRQKARITGRRRNRQRGIRGIDVDRRYVQLKARVRLLEIKAAHAFYIREERDQLELDANPIAPLPLAQHKFPDLHRDFRDRLKRVNRNREWFLSGGRAFSK